MTLYLKTRTQVKLATDTSTIIIGMYGVVGRGVKLGAACASMKWIFSWRTDRILQEDEMPAPLSLQGPAVRDPQRNRRLLYAKRVPTRGITSVVAEVDTLRHYPRPSACWRGMAPRGAPGGMPGTRKVSPSAQPGSQLGARTRDGVGAAAEAEVAGPAE